MRSRPCTIPQPSAATQTVTSGLRKLKKQNGAYSVCGLIRTDEHFKPTGGNISFHGNRGIHTPLLTVAGPHAIRIEKPAPIDPFDVPELKTLHPTWPEDLETSSRCRTQGLVLTTARPNGFLLRTADGRLVNIDLADGTPPEVGAQVTVAGLPVTDLYRINLTRAIWKRADGGSAFGRVQPEETRISDLLTDGKGHAQYKIGKFGKTLRLSGTVRSLPAPGGSEQLVTLEQDGHKFSCTDNGCGFDVAQAPSSAAGHFGLQGIRDRIRTFNGSFKLTSAPGKGTKAVVHLCPTPLET